MKSHSGGLLDSPDDVTTGSGSGSGSTWKQLCRTIPPARSVKLLNPSNLIRGARHIIAPRHKVDEKDHKPLRPTAYLDGLRGFAAFLVYWQHNQLWAHAFAQGREQDIFENAWGWKGHYHLATFYGIRTFFTGGHLSVAIFYVISGYVLTVKSLQLLQTGQHLRLSEVVASALFRRWFRLYIPLIVTTFVYVTFWHMFGVYNSWSDPKETYREEVWNWYVEFKNFSYIFKEGPNWPSYNGHLWSIPLEMRGSIVTYLSALTLSRATAKARLLCEVGLIIYFLYITDAWYAAVFMGGMLQADLDLLSRRPEPNSGFPDFLRRLERYKTPIVYTTFIVGIFLGGVPSNSLKIEDMRKNPGWYWLSYLKPQAVFDPKWFYLAIAANLIVLSIPRIPWLKRFFESKFCQYLGHISFSLYLVHGPVLVTLGDRLYHAVGYVSTDKNARELVSWWIDRFPLPKSGPMGLEPAFLLPQIIILPITLWLSEFVTRTVDEPSVKLAQWFWKVIQPQEEATEVKDVEGISVERAA